VKPKIEFVYDPLNDTTLILVWKGMAIVHKEENKGALDRVEQEKIVKKYKRKYKNAK
jgi:hypothetical protein